YICNALSGQRSEIVCEATSLDIEATKTCLQRILEVVDKDSLGRADGAFRTFASQQTRECDLPCGESGSTMRFLLPVVGALGIKANFLPEGRLPARPMSPLREELCGHGMSISPQGQVPFRTRGQLRPGNYVLPGNVSSQFISGLLFALPLLNGNSTLTITGKMESESYVGMTLEMLAKFNVTIERTPRGFLIRGNQSFKGLDKVIIEGDWSNAAFWAVCGAIAGEDILEPGEAMECNNLNLESLQGDKAIANIVSDFGASVTFIQDGIRVGRGQLRAIDIDARNIPDLVPPLALVAAVSSGTTRIYNASRLRLKESDRLQAVWETLNNLGADVTQTEDGLIITGKSRLAGGMVDSFGDHRIAMMAAIASTVCDGSVTIKGADAVNKSYPGFYKELEKLNLGARLILE
ncbi:MAG TPA: 3-phosphoshikimate 1-carboxyvinyltransferase, partial [Anaerovoracaceae bacterium]|nr:3-phosphoshikimate 1-carboxyvinyltransferase [Anaerovoracaceae bacterium]